MSSSWFGTRCTRQSAVGLLQLQHNSVRDQGRPDASHAELNLHFSAAQTNFRILEYRLPHGPNYVFDAGGNATPKSETSAGAWYVKDPYLPKDGYLELRPDRPGWGVEMDMDVLSRDAYVHWERKVPIRPDGSTGYV